MMASVTSNAKKDLSDGNEKTTVVAVEADNKITSPHLLPVKKLSRAFGSLSFGAEDGRKRSSSSLQKNPFQIFKPSSENKFSTNLTSLKDESLCNKTSLKK